jgi:hypothetical protein
LFGNAASKDAVASVIAVHYGSNLEFSGCLLPGTMPRPWTLKTLHLLAMARGQSLAGRNRLWPKPRVKVKIKQQQLNYGIAVDITRVIATHCNKAHVTKV